MKAYLGIVLCACIMILPRVYGNTILGKFDTSSNNEYSSHSSKNGESEKFGYETNFKEFTSWEVKPDKTCIKRIVKEFDGIETENKEIPIDCSKALQEAKAYEEKTRREIAEQLRKVKEEQENLRKQHAEFAAQIQKELNNFRTSFKF